jgi:hypothetical protein
MDENWYKTVALPNWPQIEKFQQLLDSALVERGGNPNQIDITDPVVMQELVYGALRKIGHSDLVDDLSRSGRRKKGRFTRTEALDFLNYHPGVHLQYAYQLLPKTPKQRAKRKRVAAKVWPHTELTRYILFLENLEGLKTAQAIRRCKKLLNLNLEENELHSIYSHNVDYVKSGAMAETVWL